MRPGKYKALINIPPFDETISLGGVEIFLPKIKIASQTPVGGFVVDPGDTRCVSAVDQYPIDIRKGDWLIFPESSVPKFGDRPDQFYWLDEEKRLAIVPYNRIMGVVRNGEVIPVGENYTLELDSEYGEKEGSLFIPGHLQGKKVATSGTITKLSSNLRKAIKKESGWWDIDPGTRVHFWDKETYSHEIGDKTYYFNRYEGTCAAETPSGIKAINGYIIGSDTSEKYLRDHISGHFKRESGILVPEKVVIKDNKTPKWIQVQSIAGTPLEKQGIDPGDLVLYASTGGRGVDQRIVVEGTELTIIKLDSLAVLGYKKVS